MSRKTIALGAPAALGLLVMAWALVGAREEPAVPRPKPPRARMPELPSTSVAEDVAFAPASTSPAAVAVPVDVAIRSRIGELEQRLAALEARKELLEFENQGLEREVVAKQAQAAALSTAQWRVRAWEKMLGLSEAQKQDLLDLVVAWVKEDVGAKASREAWAAREVDLRARLSSEQAARLGESVTSTAAQQWRFMGQTIGNYAGLPAGEHARIQQVVGAFRAPPNALLQEAHGLDWAGMFQEAAARARPLLTPEQAARMEKHMGKN